jgi:HK97 family phage portal protein
MNEDAITVRPTLFTRILRSIGLLPSGEVEFVAGADYAAAQPASPQYPKGDALSAYAAFPWVYACMDAIASDLAGLPLVVIRGKGEDAERIDNHPVLELLQNPSTRVSANLFRKQLVTDYVLTGDAYAVIAGDSVPMALLRMVPQRVMVKPWADGQPSQYVYDSGTGERVYQWEEVLHIRSPSWEDDPSNLFGTGSIRPLDHDLRTELSALKSAEETAKTGRPSGIISPSEDGDRWSAEQVKRIREGYQKQLGGQSGVLILGGAARFDSLSMTPRDLEFTQQRQLTRESTLAVFGVPPTRVGLPSANYATAREQSRIYWQSLQARASFIDVEFTRLAKSFGAGDDVRVEHDFGAVEALQETRNERVARVRQWWDMGLSLADAAAYEGFEDLPESESFGFGGPEPEPEPEVDPEAEREEAEAEAVRSLLGEGIITRAQIFERYYDPSLSIDDYPVPETREERVTVWRSYIDRLHKPAERAFRLTMRTFLRDQQGRIVRRLSAVGRKSMSGSVTRSLTDQEMQAVLDEMEELAKLDAAVRPIVKAVAASSFEIAKRQLGSAMAGVKWDPVRREELTETEIKRLAQLVTKTTMQEVQATVSKGLDEGLPIRDIAKRLEQSHTFSGPRSMMVARTEATRLTNAAALSAMEEATELGLTVWKMWDTAGDGRVRDSHIELDGATVLSDGLFNTSWGPIRGPGLSGDPSFDINCRCNLLQYIDKEEADEEAARRTDEDNPREW